MERYVTVHLALYYPRHSPRGRSVMHELGQGITQSDLPHKLKIYTEDTYHKPLPVDGVALYGLSGNLMRIVADYRARGVPTVFFDLPYWGRKHEPYPQCHRFAINAYQPTAYFRRNASAERFLMFERTICPWQSGGEEILVAGMSEKQTQVWGLGPALAYHTDLIKQIRTYTDRPIAWRPKPSCEASRAPIPGTRFAVGRLVKELTRTYCVVTYRSNVALDGLLAGVPCCVLGDHPTELMGRRHLADLERPYYPEDRFAFCADLAWCQTTMQELRNGWAWRFIWEQVEHGCT